MRLVTGTLWAAALSSALLLGGCGGNSGNAVPAPAPTAAPVTAMNLYVANGPALPGATSAPASVDVYPLSAKGLAANGTVTPSRTIVGASTGLAPDASPDGLAVDPSGRLYVAANDQIDAAPSIQVYAAGANGNAAPIASYVMSETIDGMAISRGRVYTLSLNTLIGAAMPGSNLSMTTATLPLPAPASLTADSAGFIYTIDEFDDVAVYAPGAATPYRTFTAGLGQGVTSSIALDPIGNIYVGSGGQVQVFANNATGTPQPTRTISGAKTTLSSIIGLAADAYGNIYVLDQALNGVAVFGSSANGNAAPSTTIIGGSAGLSVPTAIAVGP